MPKIKDNYTRSTKKNNAKNTFNKYGKNTTKGERIKIKKIENSKEK